MDTIAGKVATDASDITRKQREYVGILTWVNGLREVDQEYAALPVEDVVFREVTMNTVVR